MDRPPHTRRRLIHAATALRADVPAPAHRHRRQPGDRRLPPTPPEGPAPPDNPVSPDNPVPPSLRRPRRPRLHDRESARPTAHGHVQRQRGDHDRRVARLVRARRCRDGDGTRGDRAGRPLDRTAGRPPRPGPDRRACHGLRPAGKPGAAVVRALRGAGLDPVRRGSRHGHHPQHGRYVPCPLGSPPPGRSGRRAHRELLRTGRGRALFHAGPGTGGLPVRRVLPGGGHARRRRPADDRRPRLRRPALDGTPAPPTYDDLQVPRPGPRNAAPPPLFPRHRRRVRLDGGRHDRIRGRTGPPVGGGRGARPAGGRLRARRGCCTGHGNRPVRPRVAIRCASPP